MASADLTSWQVLACMALAMGAAILSVRYVEAPFRDRKAMPARRAYPMLSAGIALVCAAGIAAILSDGAPQRFRPATLQLAAGAANFSTLGKECRNTDFSTVMERCRIGAEVAPSFVLWGDSHAAALSPALALVAAKANRSGLIIASDGCLPAIDFAQSELTKVDRARCLAQARAFTRFLAEHPELDTVIVTARWYKRENPDPVIMAAMERTIDWLRANDRAIVLIAGLPVPDSDVPWRLAASDAVGRVVPPFVHRRDEGPFYAMLESAGSKSRLRYIPLAPALCDGERCLAEFEGRSLFADDDHLTVFAAERLVAPYLDRVGLFAARAPSSSR